MLTRSAPAVRRRSRERGYAVLPLLPASVVAAASGFAYAFAFPAPNVWLLAFVGLGGLLVTLRGRGFRSGLLVGAVFGAAFWLTLIDWVALFLGPVPLAALAGLQTLFVAAGCGLIAVALRSVPAVWASRWGRVGVTPLVVAAAWTCREVVAGTWPYGGFAWGRLALSQSTSPFAHLVAWFGLSGTGFVLAWLTAFAVALATERPGGIAGPRPDRASIVLPRLLLGTVAAGLVVAIPAFPITATRSLRVAAVQPNTHAGYFDPQNDPAANLDQAVRATGRAVGQGAELVIWPEGAVQIDPARDAGVRDRLDIVTEAVGAPLLTGAITERGGVARNSSIPWNGGAVQALYDKVHPVPFGEYVPDRAFWRPFAPDLIDLIGRDYAIGVRSPALAVAGTTVGVSICFDIVDDGLMLGAVSDGAQLLVGQTNNADFGTTDENEQQLAIARLRAIETGRALVNDSTVASTAAIGPDGRTLAALPPFRAGVMTVDVPLATGTTPAVAFGVPLGAAIAVLGGVLPLLAAGLARRPRRHGDA